MKSGQSKLPQHSYAVFTCFSEKMGLRVWNIARVVEFASFSEGSNNTGESLCNNVDLRSVRNGRGLVCCHLYLYVMKVQGGSRS